MRSDDREAVAAFVVRGITFSARDGKPRWPRWLGVSRETVSRWVSSGDIPRWALGTVAYLSCNGLPC